MSGGDVLTILFTDLVGSTGLRAELGDDAADPLIAAHLERVGGSVAHHDGVVVKTLGDGVLATFRSARRALTCACVIQRAEAFEDDRMAVRIGIDAGEVMERDGDVHGFAVASCARIVALGEGGDILVGDLVRKLAGPDPSLRFVDRGLVTLKGIPEAVHIRSLQWADRSSEPAPISQADAPEPSASPRIEISLLGKQQVFADGAPLESIRSARTLELLAYLAVHRGAPQRRLHVAGVLWPDSTDRQARTNLRRELHQLREALPEPDRFLTADAREIRWTADASDTLDVAAFEAGLAEADAAQERRDAAAFRQAAEGAVQAYGGDLLPGLYSDWVLAERDRLHRSFIGLLDRLTTALAEEGELRSAIDHARRRVDLEPLEESGYRRLMDLQGRAGDRAAALATYHRCTSTLQHELDVEPSADTVVVYRRLFAESSTPSVSVSEAPQDAPLIGRSAELEALRSAWAGAVNMPRMLVVAGEAGMGKTRLVAELAAAVRRDGGVVAQARCFASKGRLALAPVAEWLRSPALRPGLARLEPVWHAEVARLVPEIRTGEAQAAPAPLADAWQRRRFFEGMARAVLASEPRTLLVLDDLQWCDTETLAWLELLVHLDPSASLLVAATLRAEEVDDNPDLVAFCRRLRSQGTLRQLELAPLESADTAKIAAALIGRSLDDEALRQLQATTGGVPLFIVEAARQGSDRSARVEALLANRLAQLSPEAHEVAGVAAAVGRDFPLELLEAAADVSNAALVGAVDELWRRRLLREHSGTTYDFSHDLLRDAAYEQVTPPHRRLLHRRIADALEQLHAVDPAPAAAQIADQRERAGQPGHAIRYHTLAAETTTAVFAIDDAVRHYRRALELLRDLDRTPERDAQELGLLRAMLSPLNPLRGYSADEVGAVLRRAVELSGELGEGETELEAEMGLWAHLFVRGRIADAVALAEGLLPRLPDHPDLAGPLHLTNAGGLISLGRPLAALEHFTSAEELTTPGAMFLIGFHVRVMVFGWRAHALWLVGRAVDAEGSADAAEALADELDHPYSQVVGQAYAAIAHCLLGDKERTVELAVSVRRLCDRYGIAYYGDWGRILEGWTIGGAAGEALIRQGIESLRAKQAMARLPFYLALLAEVLRDSGRPGEASRVLRDARSVAEPHQDVWWLPELWRLDAGLDPGSDGDAMLEQAATLSREQGSRALELRAVTDLARRRVEAGRHAEAAALLEPVRAGADGCNPADVAAADDVLTASNGTPAEIV